MKIDLTENKCRPGLFISPDGRAFVELKFAPSSGGYHTTHVPALGKTGRGVTVRRHTLIAETFHGPAPYAGAQVRHRDGKPGNDKPSNLKWGTAKQNGQDTIRHGRTTRGAKNARAKLTETQAREIKRRLAKGESGLELAREFNLKPPTISNIKTGSTWGWLKV